MKSFSLAVRAAPKGGGSSHILNARQVTDLTGVAFLQHRDSISICRKLAT